MPSFKHCAIFEINDKRLQNNAQFNCSLVTKWPKENAGRRTADDVFSLKKITFPSYKQRNISHKIICTWHVDRCQLWCNVPAYSLIQIVQSRQRENVTSTCCRKNLSRWWVQLCSKVTHDMRNRIINFAQYSTDLAHISRDLAMYFTSSHVFQICL